MPSKFDRCIRKVERSGSARNPYAVCRAALNKGNPNGGETMMYQPKITTEARHRTPNTILYNRPNFSSRMV